MTIETREITPRKIMIWVNGNFIGTFPKTIAEIKIRKFGGKL